MSVLAILYVMIVILAGSCVQSALGFGTTMITMGFLPLIMEYSKAMGLSIVMVTISTIYISVKYRDSIRWAVMLPFLIPTAFSDKIHITPNPVSGTILGVICGICYGLFASGGPTAALYLLPATKSKKEYLATIQAFLCV